MSLIGIYNASELANSQIVPRVQIDHRLTNITMDSIKSESPECVRIAEKLNIELEDLLNFEKYKHVVDYILAVKESMKDNDKDRLVKLLENYRSPHLFLSRQAANRIQVDSSYYENMTKSHFKQIYEEIKAKYNNLYILIQ